MTDGVSFRPADPTRAPDRVLDVGLVAMLLAAVAGYLFRDAATGFGLAFMVHIALSLFHGRFGRVRTLAWVTFFCSWTITFAIGFAGYVLPWGQLSFWLAAHLPNAFWTEIAASGGSATLFLPIAGGLVLIGTVVDVVSLHGPRLRTSRVVQAAAVTCVVLVVVAAAGDVMRLVNVKADRPEPLSPPAILPPMGFLPFFSLLRAGPTKILGVMLLPLFALLAALWPWRAAWRFRAEPTRLIFFCSWLGACAAWIGLGLLGAAAPESWVIVASQALALYELAFLALLPTVLARFLKSSEDRPTGVF